MWQKQLEFLEIYNFDWWVIWLSNSEAFVDQIKNNNNENIFIMRSRETYIGV